MSRGYHFVGNYAEIGPAGGEHVESLGTLPAGTYLLNGRVRLIEFSNSGITPGSAWVSCKLGVGPDFSGDGDRIQQQLEPDPTSNHDGQVAAFSTSLVLTAPTEILGICGTSAVPDATIGVGDWSVTALQVDDLNP